MAVQQTDTTVEVRTALALWVPRDAMGDLTAGVRDVLLGVDGVEAATVVEVTDLRPTATDLRVQAEADLRLDRDRAADTDAARKLLADGFGVTDVEHVTLDAR